MQIIKDKGLPIKSWTDGVPFEEQAKQQLINIAQLPFIYKHIAVMPDVHLGKGATVGSVIPTREAIIPAAVGVDIGCGMMAVKIPVAASQLPDNLYNMRCEIEKAVPHGRTDNGGANDRGAWRYQAPALILEKFNLMADQLSRIAHRHPAIKKAANRAHQHLGTLGTGNHFIELCLDERQNVWVMLHSGSRGIGNKIGSYFIELAKKDMQRWFINLPDKDLAYFPEGTEHFEHYLEAVGWAQNYAKINREIIMENVLEAINRSLNYRFNLHQETLDMAVNCHHNYVAKENHFNANVWVTRKGAVRAREGDLGIIPGSMGARSYIVRGKGNPESFCSCSHGAGRAMSRGEAKRKFSIQDHELATSGVECRKDEEVIDETPMAYKDIDAVMLAQSDLIEIVHTLKQVVCVKG